MLMRLFASPLPGTVSVLAPLPALILSDASSSRKRGSLVAQTLLALPLWISSVRSIPTGFTFMVSTSNYYLQEILHGMYFNIYLLHLQLYISNFRDEGRNFGAPSLFLHIFNFLSYSLLYLLEG